MAAKGTKEKEIITKKIFEMFPGSFMDGKIIRIPMVTDDNEAVEIKVSLTCAKNILGGSPKATPTAPAANDWSDDVMNKPDDTKMTKQETEKVKNIMERLGL